LHKDGGPFRRVLIANRGEIAVRISRACRELNMESVAIYSDIDVDAGHVRRADRAVHVGPTPAIGSYLDIDRVLAAAVTSGCDAVHPGYGFLAERADFAKAVEGAGLAFVGPTSGTIASLGDKLEGRRIARRAGVDSVPGTMEAIEADPADHVESAIAAAREVGFPLLVKASAGGGGRGIRRVERPADLPAALTAGAAEATSTFGRGVVYLERVIEPARHVEVQLLGDRAGNVVAVGERDCSLQRRHQKLVEEAPAPGLSVEMRRDLHARAVRIGEAAGLTNAATVEFLLDDDGGFWFLEVNTRLQVEHGVTELVADLDIVREQFLLAAGFDLSPAARAAADVAAEPRRHAIEVRLSAEDPSREFAAAPGTVGRWSMPAGPGVRVDTAIESGDRVPPDYDPLVAKLLVVAHDRNAAIDRLRRALDEVEVSGIQTTLPFHRFVAAHPGFRAGEIATGWVGEEWDPVAAERRRGAFHHAAALAAIAAAPGVDRPNAQPPTGGRSATSPSPWARAGRASALDRWPR
jgi:acetyl/propionyl-CoA carboxylase alpha subunit